MESPHEYLIRLAVRGSLARDFKIKTNLQKSAYKNMMPLGVMPCFGFIDNIPRLFDTPARELFLISFAAFAEFNTVFFRSFNF